MFCLSGMICFFYLDWYFVYLDWYVLSLWIDMFCLINQDRQNILIRMDRTYHSRQTKHIIPDRQNISIQTEKHINPDRQNISIQIRICFVCLDWYVLSVWNDLFCPSGLRCFDYLDWYVLSVWNDMLCPFGLRCFIYLDWYVFSIWNEHINPDRQNISFQIDKT
jgi:hypothetical protein